MVFMSFQEKAKNLKRFYFKLDSKGRLTVVRSLSDELEYSRHMASPKGSV